MATTAPSTEQPDSADDRIQRILEMARHHLGMEFAFLGEFVGQEEVFTHVEGPQETFNIAPGGSIPLDGSYCARVMDGRLPSIVQDSLANAEVRDLAVTADVGIGSYLGVPVRLADGSTYGALCCISHAANPDLREYDARFMGLLADLMAKAVEHQQLETSDQEDLLRQVSEVISDERFHPVFQPIVNIATGQVVGLEALTRFTPTPLRTPDLWFAQAWRVGVGQDLEIAAVRAALQRFESMDPGLYLSINLSAQSLITADLPALVGDVPPDRLQIEVTEHDVVEDYESLRAVRDRLRKAGIRFAIDDAGAGFASLKHIIRLVPDVIKLDIFLTRDIHLDPVKRALASSLVAFAAEAGSRLIAEGVETTAELETLRGLGLDYVQGYLTGKPAPIEQVPLRVEMEAVGGTGRSSPRPLVADAGDPAVQAAFNLAPLAMITADAATNIAGWNLAAERLFGWSALEARGRRMVDLLVPERYRTELVAWLERNRDRERPGEVVEAFAIHRDGREIPVAFSIAPVPAGQGTTYLVFARDPSSGGA